MTTKKNLLIISGIISIITLVVNYVGIYKICNNVFECTEILFVAVIILFPIIPFFIFSLITYKMKDKVFQLWWKFARVWIPVSMLAILISPSYSSNFMLPIEKGSVAFFSSVIFIIVSAVLIIQQSLSSRKK